MIEEKILYIGSDFGRQTLDNLFNIRKKLQVDIRRAADIDEGFRIFMTPPRDSRLVIADCGILNGIRFLRRTNGYRTTKIVLSTYLDQNVLDQASKYGCREIVLKPYDPQFMAAVVEELIKNRNSPTLDAYLRNPPWERE